MYYLSSYNFIRRQIDVEFGGESGADIGAFFGANSAPVSATIAAPKSAPNLAPNNSIGVDLSAHFGAEPEPTKPETNFLSPSVMTEPEFELIPNYFYPKLLKLSVAKISRGGASDPHA